MVEHHIVRLTADPAAERLEPQTLDLGQDLIPVQAVADQGVTEVDPAAAQDLQGREDRRDPLFRGQPGDGQNPEGRCGRRLLRAVAAEESGVDPVVDAVDGGGRAGGQPPQVAPVVLGAGDDEARAGDLLPQLIGIGGVDVLGVGRKAERQPREGRGVKGDRGGRMGEVGVQVGDPAARQAGVHQPARLQEMAQRGRVAGAPETPEQHPEPGSIAPRIANQLAEVAGDEPVGVAQEGFGQVVHPGADPGDARVGEGFAPGTNGEDVNLDSELLEQQDLIGNEGLGDPGITLQDHPQHRPGGGAHGLWSRNSRIRCFMISMPVNRNPAMASR